MHDDDAVGLPDFALMQGHKPVPRHVAHQLAAGEQRIEAFLVQIMKQGRVPVPLQRIHHRRGDGGVEAVPVGMPKQD